MHANFCRNTCLIIDVHHDHTINSYNKFKENTNTSTRAENLKLYDTTFPVHMLSLQPLSNSTPNDKSDNISFFFKNNKVSFMQFIILLSLIFNPIQVSFRCTRGVGASLSCGGMLLNSNHIHYDHNCYT